MKKLTISENKKYIMQEGKPFFWLGDTAWLLFQKTTEADAYVYLKNRAEKGFNVIQAVLVYAIDELSDINKMYVPPQNIDENYWLYCDKIIKKADELGLYMGLLPSWGSLVKNGIITEDNAEKYADFLAHRYKDYTNIIWILGGDIRATGYEKIYEIFANKFKKINPERLITFHPFGRCCSSTWFNNSSWLDFNMFQSGHRRYDQCNLGKWDDNKNSEEFFGEDNFKYVLSDLTQTPLKPTLDAEPIYEFILQGLHDVSQPYWETKDIRRYAYWSVFAGACGHTYGDNSIMQFFTKSEKDKGSYGVKCNWKDALHHDGSGQMKYLKELMEKVDFTTGECKDDLIISSQGEKYERIAVFAGDGFIFAYSFTGKGFEIDISRLNTADVWQFSPSNGIYSYVGKTNDKTFLAKPHNIHSDDKDVVFVFISE